MKCQDQVCSSKVRWQTDLVTEKAAAAGLGKVDRFDFLGGRPQPDGRSQKQRPAQLVAALGVQAGLVTVTPRLQPLAESFQPFAQGDLMDPLQQLQDFIGFEPDQQPAEPSEDERRLAAMTALADYVLEGDGG